MTDTKYKYIGFEIEDTKDKVYKTLLRSIILFTIPNSTANIFYKDKKGHFFNKTFLKKSNVPYYMNGDCSIKKCNYENDIFKCVSQYTFR